MFCSLKKVPNGCRSGFDQIFTSFKTAFNIYVRIQKYKGCSNETRSVMFCSLKKVPNGCRSGSYEDVKGTMAPVGGGGGGACLSSDGTKHVGPEAVL
jgi:hypothetical protein